MNISSVDARALFTKEVIAVYQDILRPTSFLRSFFAVSESTTKNVSIEVERNSEPVAVDVIRGTEGNRNTFSNSTEKIITPPYYREYLELTSLDGYDRLFSVNTDSVNENVFNEFLAQVAKRMDRLVYKIERSHEKQAADVFETGILTLSNGTTIDFKRKADSKVTVPTWATGTNDPFDAIEDGCNFLRTAGKAQGGVINMICGQEAWAAFLKNDIVKARADVRNFSLDAVRAPQRNAVGGTLLGESTAGSYIVRCWGYPEFYTNASGVATPYLNTKKVILLPEAPSFTMAYAAVPKVWKEGTSIEPGMYHFGEYMDERKKSHIMDVESAAVAVPVAVDQIYTMQVLAS